MRIGTHILGIAFGAVLFAGVASAQLAPTSAAQWDTLYSWDDAEADSFLYGGVGSCAAVMFTAHPRTQCITGIHVYTGIDICCYPAEPTPPPWREFLVSVWRPSSDDPPVPLLPVGLPASSGEYYPEGAWVELTLPSPIEISNEDDYPDRVFFAVVQWQRMCSPFVGIDFDDPQDGKSLWHRYSWDEWDCYPGDLMIRAVGIDSLGVSVEQTSWGTVKSIYR